MKYIQVFTTIHFAKAGRPRKKQSRFIRSEMSTKNRAAGWNRQMKIGGFGETALRT